MQNLIKTLADALFVDLVNKDYNGADINKNEFDVMIEAYKTEHKNRVDECSGLTLEQKRKLKDTFNKTLDNFKEYSQECLRINGRLIE